MCKKLLFRSAFQEIWLSEGTGVVVSRSVLDVAGIEYDCRDCDPNGKLLSVAGEVPIGQTCFWQGAYLTRIE